MTDTDSTVAALHLFSAAADPGPVRADGRISPSRPWPTAESTRIQVVESLDRYRERISGRAHTVRVNGWLVRTIGLIMEACGVQGAIGERCFIEDEIGRLLPAEIVGFDGSKVLLMAEGHGAGLAPGARVIPAGRLVDIAVGPELLGRVIDSGGAAIDGRGPLWCSERVPLLGQPLNPMRRALVDTPLDVGVRSINALFTVGRGARLGLFAGSGVGKSVLLGMMARYTEADVTVIGLIGERSREVKEFVERILGAEGLARAVVVVAPASDSALQRVHAAQRAVAIAEYFRDQGRRVLLLMDSLTRFAMAQREIGLSVGEMPATRGYPPSVFGRITALCERAGNGEEGSGSITAFYTVLIEGDDLNDPIADATRGILDGSSRAVAAVCRCRAVSGDRRRCLDQPRHARCRRPGASRRRAAVQAAPCPSRRAPRYDRDRRLSTGARWRTRPRRGAAPEY